MSSINIVENNEKLLQINKLSSNDIHELSFNNYITFAKVISVYDGDTATLGFPIPNTDIIFKWKCRLQGIDTPELRTKDMIEKKLAIEAKNALEEMMKINSIVKIHCGKFDKYGRILVNIYTLNEDYSEKECVNDFLLKNNYAVKYYGGKKN